MISVLDHGYVELVETWGSDERIIEAARMSTGKGFVSWYPYLQCRLCGEVALDYDFRLAHEQNLYVGICSHPNAKPSPDGTHPNIGRHDWEKHPKGDAGLLRFLWENKHHTPFEMAGATFEIQAPIFVFREWHRHRTQSFNELSARYTPLPDVNYVPTAERLLVNSKTNKQAGTAKGAAELNADTANVMQYAIKEQYEQAQFLYDELLKGGAPKELARIILPVGRYSRMRASANLRNWLAFLTLRMDSAAQFEIRAYAEAVHKMLSEKFPRTLDLFFRTFAAEDKP
jgi:thymidylate synthase (FAD)